MKINKYNVLIQHLLMYTVQNLQSISYHTNLLQDLNLITRIRMATPLFTWPPPTSTMTLYRFSYSWVPASAKPHGNEHSNPTDQSYLFKLQWSRFGVTPLHIATSSGHTPCVELLIQWGANVNAQESWGQTPLIIATSRSRLQTMVALIRLGANLELKDYHHGQTALHVACASKDEETVLVLLDAGADLTATDGSGLSPLGVALVNKFYRCVPLLLEYGAKLNDRDKEHLPQLLVVYVDQQRGESDCE